MDTALGARVGGGPAATEVVNRLYRAILAYDRLRPHFAGVDPPRLKPHPVALLSPLLGGPESGSGRELRAAHAGQEISQPHLIGVPASLGTDDDLLAAARSVLAETADDIAV
jgi:truncated hemoglobin YjbI